jgi:hypothetical protein
MIGNKLPDIIPDGTLCKMYYVNLGYGVIKKLPKKSLLIKMKIVVTIKEFRGYHEYSEYTIEYMTVTAAGLTRKILLMYKQKI